jgi:hypothetical protein
MTQPLFRPRVEALDDRRLPSATGVPHLTHHAASLVRLEDLVNQDPRVQRQFLADPGALLRQAGVQLAPAQEQALRAALAQAAAPLPDVPGASVSPLSGFRQVIFDDFVNPRATILTTE